MGIAAAPGRSELNALASTRARPGRPTALAAIDAAGLQALRRECTLLLDHVAANDDSDVVRAYGCVIGADRVDGGSPPRCPSLHTPPTRTSSLTGSAASDRAHALPVPGSGALGGRYGRRRVLGHAPRPARSHRLRPAHWHVCCARHGPATARWPALPGSDATRGQPGDKPRARVRTPDVAQQCYPFVALAGALQFNEQYIVKPPGTGMQAAFGWHQVTAVHAACPPPGAPFPGPHLTCAFACLRSCARPRLQDSDYLGPIGTGVASVSLWCALDPTDEVCVKKGRY